MRHRRAPRVDGAFTHLDAACAPRAAGLTVARAHSGTDIMDLYLSGKRAVVTGGSRGIGFAIADALAAEGAEIAIVARDHDRLAAAAGQLRQRGVRVLALSADITDDKAVRAAISQVVEEFGGVDILVNSAATPAGASEPRDLSDLVDDDILSAFDTKVLGYLRTARAAAPHMIAQGWGRIINISGLAARSVGTVSGSVRNVAVAALTKTLADELGPHGINVTVVHPGWTVTERTSGHVAAYASARGVTEGTAWEMLAKGISIGRPVAAAELADVVVFLASPRSVAIAGDAIAAGGGARGPIHY
jgi:NAD(P)-dependent dehydrogenase (short-subunit alcohol dehydrogenase family)